MKANIKIQIQAPINIFQEDGMFVSHCPVFDISSQGETRDEARENLIEAISVFLFVCFEMGTLETVLKESGFAPGETPDRLPPSPNEDYIDIPLPFMLASSDLKECHA